MAEPAVPAPLSADSHVHVIAMSMYKAWTRFRSARAKRKRGRKIRPRRECRVRAVYLLTRRLDSESPIVWKARDNSAPVGESK